MHRSKRLGLAIPAVAGLIAGGLATSAAAAPHHASTQRVTIGATYKAVIKNGKLTLTGPKTVPAGLVNVSLHSATAESTLGVLSFKSGYSWADFMQDRKATNQTDKNGQPTKSALRHYRNLIRHTFGYGGFDVTAKKTSHGTLLFNRAGSVYIYNDSGNLPKQIHKITVVGTTPLTSVPKSGPTVTMSEQARFGGARNLPASGTITVKNTSNDLLHLDFMQHVKKGTTRQEVINGIENNDFSFGRPGSAGADVLSAGRSQTITYRLPAGTYAEICFMPDPKTGMPHFAMGMVRIVHLG